MHKEKNLPLPRTPKRATICATEVGGQDLGGGCRVKAMASGPAVDQQNPSGRGGGESRQ